MLLAPQICEDGEFGASVFSAGGMTWVGRGSPGRRCLVFRGEWRGLVLSCRAGAHDLRDLMLDDLI